MFSAICVMILDNDERLWKTSKNIVSFLLLGARTFPVFNISLKYSSPCHCVYFRASIIKEDLKTINHEPENLTRLFFLVSLCS